MFYFFQTTLQTIINRYISLDKEIEQKLKPLRGKILEINIKKTPFHYGFLFTKNNIEIISADKIAADAVISGDLFTFLKLFKSSSLSNMSKLSITGDQAFSESAYHLLHDLDIDWEEVLSHYTGDVIAHKVGQCVDGLQKWFSRGAHSFKVSLTEYVQEELRYFPSTVEMNDFMKEVDELKHDLDRVSLRLSRYLQENHE
jgi:ubiquinone biosynthesis protein UbiJ